MVMRSLHISTAGVVGGDTVYNTQRSMQRAQFRPAYLWCWQLAAWLHQQLQRDARHHSIHSQLCCSNPATCYVSCCAVLCFVVLCCAVCSSLALCTSPGGSSAGM